MECPIHALLIEDNPGDADLIREMLDDADDQVEILAVETRLESGLERLGKEGVDVLLLDLSLPDSRGIETFRRAHAACPDVPILVLTGLEDGSLGAAAVRGGAQDYLIKGKVEGSALARAIRFAVERKRFEAERWRWMEELLQARRLEGVGSLAGQVARDLDHAMTEVQLQIETIWDALPEESPLARRVAGIERAVARAAALVREMLAVGSGPVAVQPDLDKTAATLVLSELGADVSAVLEDLAPLLGSASGGAPVRLHLGRNLPNSRCEEAALREMVLGALRALRGSVADGGDAASFQISSGVVELSDDEIAERRLTELSAGTHLYVEISHRGAVLPRAMRVEILKARPSVEISGPALAFAIVLWSARSRDGAMELVEIPGGGLATRLLLPVIEETVDHGAS